MWKLLFFTIQIMGLTFLIGFLVAGAIKLTAMAADYFEFHNSHEAEIRRLRAQKRLRKKRIVASIYNAQDMEAQILEHHINGVSRGKQSPNEMDFHGVSPGVSSFDLLDYYNSAHVDRLADEVRKGNKPREKDNNNAQ